MAIAFDDASEDNGTWGTNLSSLTWSHTCTGSNRFLAVGVHIYDSAALTVSSITYNGVNLTRANGITAALEGNNQNVELWYLDAPASGANDIVVTLSGTADFTEAQACSYTGKTSTGIDASNATQDLVGSTTAPVCNVNVVQSDCWLVGVALSRGAGEPVHETGTQRRAWDGAGHVMGDSNGVVGTGNQTLAWSSGSGTWPGVVSFSFSEAGSNPDVTLAASGSAFSAAQTTPAVSTTVAL